MVIRSLLPSNRTLWLAIPFLICLLLHVIFAGLNLRPIGDDAYVQTTWFKSFTQALQAGELVPRWLSSTYASYGSPTFYFYPPLTYYVGALFAGLSAGAGSFLLNLTQLLGVLFSVAASALLLRRLGATRQIALLGGLIYGFNPYHFVDVFVRTAISEHMALALLPIVFLAAVKITRARSPRESATGWILSTISWAGLFLTNLPASCSAALALIVFVLCRPRRQGSVVIVFSSVLLAMLLAAYYLLPAYSLSSLIRTSRFWGSEVAVARWHHVLIEPFVRSELSIKVIYSVLVAFAFSVVVLWQYRTRYTLSKDQHIVREQLPWIAVMLVMLLLQVPFLSDWLYDLLLPLRLIQFSWRLTMIVMLCLTVLLVLELDRTKYLVMALGLMTLVFYFHHGNKYVLHDTPPYWEQPVNRDAPEYVTSYVPYTDSALIAYLKEHEHDPQIVGDRLHVSYSQIDPGGIKGRISSDQSQTIRLHQFYWPLWRVSFNGTDVATFPDHNGMLNAAIPAGNGLLEVRMSESVSERIGKFISLMSLAAFFLIALYSLKRTS